MIHRFRYSLRWLRRLLALWRSPNRRFLAYPPGHFASPLPDHDALERDHPRLIAADSLPGLDLRVAEQLELLRSITEPAKRISFPAEPVDGFRYHFENDFFTYGDALVLAGMLQHLRPRRVIEVGSGFSSALMLDLRDRTDWKPELTFIEPYPTRLRSLLKPSDDATLIESPVQAVPLSVFEALEANDVLFIDSSHVSKIGSDVNLLFFEVFPRLRPGVVVQIHDIFWPFEYPKVWYDRGWAWNEAYLVRALLQGSDRYRIRLFPSYLEARHRDELERSLPLALRRARTTPATGMSSIWLSVTG
ncbi:MAG: class I SAM-dependent methyltransferase [Gemmataceae bacterium]|nr:class I SAM-dependent methyltransferase [Gemmataceae bacterium]